MGYRVVDVACGSGDAQTLCITDDDNVWSWGDGDYGKLGRGGSDGCKVPMRIDGLANQGIIKVGRITKDDEVTDICLFLKAIYLLVAELQCICEIV